MTREQALRTAVEYFARKLSEGPAQERIAVYQALALVLPTRSARAQAAHMAWLLTETQRYQLEFSTDLFLEAQWPGHSHNGEPPSDKK
jgi:hypothetical protein